MRVVGRASNLSLGPPRATTADGFEELYRQEYPGLARLAWLLTDGVATSEDLVQEAFTALFECFDKIERPQAWLRTCLVNRCRDHHRRVARERRRLERVGSGQPVSADLGARELLDAVGRLPYDQRATLVLRYWLDLPDDVIADHLGIRRGTVRSRSARAMATLNKEIER
jgi:RNA polymerase sigma factor (sigma-70 family)